MNDNEGPYVLSLDEANVHIAQEVYEYLAESFAGLYKNDSLHHARDHMNRILDANKTAPATTTCRVNLILSTPSKVQEGLEREVVAWKNRHDSPERSSSLDHTRTTSIVVRQHAILKDVICLGAINPSPTPSKSLSSCRVPPLELSNTSSTLFQSWPTRADKGWPMNHRVVLCDRFCGEAVLRGSDIFVRGVICADMGIEPNETVAVYADISQRPVSRGLILTKFMGKCIFLGMGVAQCSRTEMVTASRGVAVEMSCHDEERVGPALPPLSGVMTGQFMMQNLPSILVAHVLDPQPGDVIIDMCSAPGGKTSHVASLVRNNATIVACDKSRKKMIAARKLFVELGATCITPIAWDSTACVVRDDVSYKSVQEILSSAETSAEDGLKNVTGFYPGSFHRVLLDPPCSALGLRPKLVIDVATPHDLKKNAKYQRQFVREAVSLLKVGGTMTYSTCTIHASENEGMVRHILDAYPEEMQLVDAGINLGLSGLPGVGLNESERRLVRRFDPSDREADTMGFFVAKFMKRKGG